jgi:hypothetical protein
VWQACTTTVILSDLHAKFLVTDRTPGFVISDHPVALTNHYVEHHLHLKHLLGITGLAAKGLQLFMPLSPSVVLAIFDPGAYEYGGKSLVCRAGPADVAGLNRMQAVTAHRCIYFDPRRMDEEILQEIMHVREKHAPVHTRSALESDFVQRDDGSLSQFVVVSGGEVRLGDKLSFVRLRDHESYHGYPYAYAPVRSQELLELSMLQRQLLDQYVDVMRARRGLPPFYAKSHPEPVPENVGPVEPFDPDDFQNWVCSKLGLLEDGAG